VDNSVTPELLGCLLDEHGGALALYAVQWTDAADDCVQEALIELARQPAVPASPVGWLYRVVRNRAISQFAQPSGASGGRRSPGGCDGQARWKARLRIRQGTRRTSRSSTRTIWLRH
jgi:hypothetical protein